MLTPLLLLFLVARFLPWQLLLPFFFLLSLLLLEARLGLYGAVTKAARGRPRVEALIVYSKCLDNERGVPQGSLLYSRSQKVGT